MLLPKMNGRQYYLEEHVNYMVSTNNVGLFFWDNNRGYLEVNVFYVNLINFFASEFIEDRKTSVSECRNFAQWAPSFCKGKHWIFDERLFVD